MSFYWSVGLGSGEGQTVCVRRLSSYVLILRSRSHDEAVTLFDGGRDEMVCLSSILNFVRKNRDFVSREHEKRLLLWHHEKAMAYPEAWHEVPQRRNCPESLTHPVLHALDDRIAQADGVVAIELVPFWVSHSVTLGDLLTSLAINGRRKD